MVLFLTTTTAALLILNFPIFMALLLGGLLTLAVFTSLPPELVVQTMFGSLNKFALVAIPFFIYTAKLMQVGGISRRLIAWVESFLCIVRGSLGITSVAACAGFSAISGSSPATVAAIGNTLYPAMLQRGYGKGFAAGIITSSGCMGIIIPPSIAMIIYASITNVSVGRLFLAGIGAGLFMTLALMAYSFAYAVYYGIGATAGFDLRRFMAASRDALWALGAPVIILGGIYAGVFTPTEAAGVVTVYAIFVVLLVYREINLSEFVEVTIDSAVLTAKIMVLVSAAGIFGWLLTVGQAHQSVLALFEQFGLHPVVVLLFINLVFLIAGMFLDPNSAQVIIVPLIFPIAVAVGLDPVHLGVVIVVNLAIGMYTPPFGLNLFVASSMFGLSYRDIVYAVMPFIVIGVLVIAAITFVPEISGFLPRWAYGL